MKICRNCNSKIEDDALVCPYCGCVQKKVKNNSPIEDQQSVTRTVGEFNNSNAPQKKRKTWLWVIGWIIAFPIPLTILMLRNQKLNKIARIAIIAVAWIVYLLFAFSSGSSSSGNSTGNIKSLKFTKDQEITVKVGETESPGYLQVKVKSSKDFTPENVVFISDNPDIATIKYTKSSMTTNLYFEISGVDGGETDVYATSADGSIKSETIHVIVPEPIRIEGIKLGEVKTNLILGETEKVSTTIYPANAEDTRLTWNSSDTSVATVDGEGNIRAIGSGTTTITVSSYNGVSESFDVTVDGTKKLMNIYATHHRENDVNIGDEWSYEYQINGENISKQRSITVGETITFTTKITESDDTPDVGAGTAYHKVTEDDLTNGFEVSFDVYVTENGGKNRGKSAHFIVTYKVSPN